MSPAVAHQERPTWDAPEPHPWASAPPADEPPLSRAMRAAQLRLEWRHVQALMQRGVPLSAMLRPGGRLTLGVVRIAGREMIVTDDARMRAYLSGPGLFAMPGGE